MGTWKREGGDCGMQATIFPDRVALRVGKARVGVRSRRKERCNPYRMNVSIFAGFHPNGILMRARSK